MSDEYNGNNYGNGPTSQSDGGNYSGNSSSDSGSYGYGSQNQGNQGGYQSAYSSGGYSGGDGGRKKGGGGKIALAVIVALVVGVAGGYGVSRVVSDQGSGAAADSETDVSEAEETTEESEAEESGDSEAEEETSSGAKLNTTTSSEVVTEVTEVVELVMPSVVSVYNTSISTMEYFGQTYSEEAVSTGTGFIVAQDEETDELLIVTNNHVVEDADSLEVQFIDESTAEAWIKGTDEGNDLAVIAIDLDDIDSSTMEQIAIATLGDSDSLRIGQSVVAIGNALGYGQSVTTGVVSALDRELTVEDVTGTFIQTDAAINPGNSGGPLVDMYGNVIGINSSKIGGSTVEGMGYAIPISRAIPIIEELMTRTTKVTVDEDSRGYLGISGVSVTSSVASAYNMPEGVYVASLIEGGAAAESELQKGDIITAINGTSISDMEGLQKELTYYAVDDEITLTVQRQTGSGEYEEMDVTVVLGDHSAIEAYEEAQEKEEQSSGHTYGYNNGGSSSGD